MLIKNALIITMDKERRAIKNGVILIEGNKIVGIGKNIDKKDVIEKAELAKEDLLRRK